MDGSDKSNRQKRVRWAKCRDPYKTTLDTLAVYWINGTLSHAELALELWKLNHKCNEKTEIEQDQGRPKLNLKDVDTDLHILAEALCYASSNPPSSDPICRSSWLETCIAHHRTAPDYCLKRDNPDYHFGR